jgi:hypothetical protein
MANNPAAAQRKRTRSKEDQTAVRSFEIIYEDSEQEAMLGAKLRRNLGPLVAAGRHVLGELYNSVAQAVLERTEDFEDRHAERKARQRAASRAVRRAISVPETRPVESSERLKSRSASPSKYSS